MGMTPQQQVRVARLDAPVSHDTLLRPVSASMSREKRVVAACGSRRGVCGPRWWRQRRPVEEGAGDEPSIEHYALFGAPQRNV